MQQQIRCLLAWMAQAEAVSTILGRLAAPNEDVSGQQRAWEASCTALQQREPYEQPTPTLDPFPPELQARADAFRQRPDVAASFPGQDWTIGMADLRSVLSFQKLVVQEQAIERANAVSVDDLGSLFSFCLPDPVADINLPGTIDQDQKAVTFSSPNPNLRIGSHLIVDIDVSPGPGQPTKKQKFVGFGIHFGSQFVQIAEGSQNRVR